MQIQTFHYQLLRHLDVESIGFDYVVSAYYDATERYEKHYRFSLLKEIIDRSDVAHFEGWDEWINVLLTKGPFAHDDLCIEFLPDDLPPPMSLEELAHIQIFLHKERARDSLLDILDPSQSKSVARYFDNLVCDLEEFLGEVSSPRTVDLQIPPFPDGFEYDENGVVKDWVIDPISGEEIYVGADAKPADTDGNPIDRMIEDMNRTTCAVLDGGKFQIMRESYDDVFDRSFLTRMGKQAFKDFYQDERVKLPDTKKEVSVAQVWLDSPNRRKYDGIVFDPNRIDPEGKRLNLWKGWGVQPTNYCDSWSLLDELILDVLCDGNLESYTFVIRWMAYMVQHPTKLPEVAIAFRGEEGTGKGTLGRVLLHIAGQHGLTVASSNQLAGRFNSHLRDCVFVFADEALWHGDKESEGLLKQLITEPIISFEAKGKDIVPGRNLVHLMLASNEDWIVPAGQTARRFFVSDVSSKRRGDRAFFGRLWRQLERGGYGQLLFDLMNLDLGDWTPAIDIPQTSALGDQKLSSLKPVETFWLELLMEGVPPSSRSLEHEDWKGPIKLVSEQKRELIESLDSFLKRNRHYGSKASAKALVQSGKPLGLEVARPGGLERVWILPPLEVMRNNFEEMIGTNGIFD